MPVRQIKKKLFFHVNRVVYCECKIFSVKVFPRNIYAYWFSFFFEKKKKHFDEILYRHNTLKMYPNFSDKTSFFLNL